MGDPSSTDNPRMAPPTEPASVRPAVHHAPPTTPGHLAPVTPAWPTTIGILAIVFGSFGVLSTVGAAAMSEWARSVSGMSYTPIGWATMVLAFLGAVWHVVAGILTLRRSRRGPPNLIAWAWANAVLVVLTAATGFGNLNATYTSGTTPPAGMMGMSYAMMVPSVLISLAWPIFLVIFLNDRARKAYWKSWR